MATRFSNGFLHCGFPRASRIASLLGGVTLAVLVMTSTGLLQAQEKQAQPEGRAALEVDRRAKHLYDKAIELMEYKQYERGLAMLDTVIRDNRGNILGYRAHMAIGRHFQDQRKVK